MKSGKVVILHSNLFEPKKPNFKLHSSQNGHYVSCFSLRASLWQWQHCVCMYRAKKWIFLARKPLLFCTTSSPLTYQIHCERENTENFDYPWIVRHFSLAFLLDWLSCLRSSGCFNPQLPMLIPLNLKTNEGKLSATLASVNFIEFRPIAYTALFIICFCNFICF